MILRYLLAPILLVTSVQVGQAANFSFTGDFTQDDNVQLFSFSVTSASTVTLRTYSYPGGTNSAGQVIAGTGFDPILALFNSTGAKVGENDDGTCSQVGSDAVTGACFDTYFQAAVTPGTYTVSLMEFDNFSSGNTLAAGFDRQGQGNFTAAAFGPAGATGPFWDFTSSKRDSHWAFDVLNVNSAVSGVPEPATFGVVTLGILAAGLLRRRFRE